MKTLACFALLLSSFSMTPVEAADVTIAINGPNDCIFYSAAGFTITMANSCDTCRKARLNVDGTVIAYKIAAYDSKTVSSTIGGTINYLPDIPC